MPVLQALRDHPCDLFFAYVLSDSHCQLHAHAELVQSFDISFANAQRIRATQCLVGFLRRAVKLQQHKNLVTIFSQSLGDVRFRKFDTVGRKINFPDALLSVQPVDYLPKVRMNSRFAACNLHRVQETLVAHQVADKDPDLIHRENSIAFRIRIADPAR